MITKIDTSYQEGNSLKNPDKLENISKGLDKELTALSENIDELIASTTYFDDAFQDIDHLKNTLIKRYGKDTVKNIDKTLNDLSTNVAKIRDIASKYNINVNDVKHAFNTFNTYYHDHYLATIARTKKVK